MRKRTYEFTGLDETKRGSGSGYHKMDEGTRQQIQAAFRGMPDVDKNRAALISGFNSPVPFEQKTGAEMVTLKQDDPTQYTFTTDPTGKGFRGSLPVALKADIIEYLQLGPDPESGKPSAEHTTDADESERSVTSTPLEIKLAAKIMKFTRKLGTWFSGDAPNDPNDNRNTSIPNPDMADLDATMAGFQSYGRDHEYYKPTSTFQLLIRSMTDSGIEEEDIQHAILEMADDGIALVDFFDNERAALDEALASKGLKPGPDGKSREICVPSSPELERMRERFFISQLKPGNRRCLSYGNLGGEATSPSKMSILMQRLDNSTLGDDVEGNWPKNKGGTKPLPGYEAAERALKNPANAVVASAQSNTNDVQNNSSALLQNVDKYKDVKICVGEGEEDRPLFKVDAPGDSTHLSSAISEKTSVLANLASQIQNAVDLPKAQRDKIISKLKDAVEQLAIHAANESEQLNALAAVAVKYKNETGSFPPACPKGIAEIVNAFEQFGVANPGFEGLDQCRMVVLAQLAREIRNPVNRTLDRLRSSGKLKGTVDIVDVHPDGRPVNKIYGILKGSTEQERGEGIWNVPYPTRAVADELIVFSSKEDVLAFFKDLGVKPDSESSRLTLEHPYIDKNGNPVYMVTLSDKFYEEAGWTSQGKLNFENALSNPEYINHTLSKVMGKDHPYSKSLTAAVEKERLGHLAELKQAVIEIADLTPLGDNPTSKEIDVVQRIERRKLTLFIKTEKKAYKKNSKEYRDLVSLEQELKEYDKEFKGDRDSAASVSQRTNLAHKVADLRRRSTRRNIKDPEERRSREAADYFLKSLASTGSGNAALNVKSWDTSEGKVIFEDDIRSLELIKIEEMMSGEFRYSNDIDKCIKSTYRRTANKDSGTVSVSVTTDVNTGSIQDLNAKIKEEKNQGLQA